MSHVEWIGTTEAARRIGVHDRTVRDAARFGQIPALREGGMWLVDAGALDSFRKTRVPWAGRPRKAHPLTPIGTSALRRLDEWGSGTAEELALVLEVNAGNVRKGLAIAEKLGLATRSGPDWSLTENGRCWLIEHAQEVAA